MNIVDHEHVLASHQLFRDGELHETGGIHSLHKRFSVLRAAPFFQKGRRHMRAAHRLGQPLCKDRQTARSILSWLLRSMYHELHAGFPPATHPAPALQERKSPSGRGIGSSPPHCAHERLSRPLVGKEGVKILKLREIETRAGKAKCPTAPKGSVTGYAQGRKENLLDHRENGASFAPGCQAIRHGETGVIFPGDRKPNRPHSAFSRMGSPQAAKSTITEPRSTLQKARISLSYPALSRAASGRRRKGGSSP